MTKKELVEELRAQFSPPVSLEEATDDEVIECYNKCSSCGNLAVPVVDLLIGSVCSATEFLHRLDGLDGRLPLMVHLPGCPELELLRLHSPHNSEER